MLLAMLIADQAAAAIRFDLRNLQPENACERNGGRTDEIVVCAPSESLARFRLRQLPADKFEAKPIRAETGLIGNVKIAAEAEKATMPDGTVSNRMMVRFKIPF